MSDFESPAGADDSLGVEKSESSELVYTPPERSKRNSGDTEWVVVVVPEGEDPSTYIPKKYVGNPIAPNKFCRGWNGKPSRMHYCSRLAGWGTDHAGVGRCKNHGGRNAIVTGSRIRYDGLHHRTIGDLVKKFQADPDPTNVLAELDLSRALLVDFIDRYMDFAEALLDWHSSFKLTKRPISEEDASGYERVVTEYAIMLKESGNYTDLQIADCTRAERFIEAFRKPVDQGRPRKVVDITEVRGIIEVIIKLVTRLDARDTISEMEMNRMISSMSRVVDVIIPNVIPKGADGAEFKRLIREGWMRAITR